MDPQNPSEPEHNDQAVSADQGFGPENDADFSGRWRLIKTCVTKKLSDYATAWLIRPTDVDNCRKSVWQHRYWEHLIRDDDDYRAHIDYIHYNPVKHGHVTRPIDWRYSSIHRFVADGRLPADWGAGCIDLQEDIGRE